MPLLKHRSGSPGATSRTGRRMKEVVSLKRAPVERAFLSRTPSIEFLRFPQNGPFLRGPTRTSSTRPGGYALYVDWIRGSALTAQPSPSLSAPYSAANVSFPAGSFGNQHLRSRHQNDYKPKQPTPDWRNRLYFHDNFASRRQRRTLFQMLDVT